MAKFKAGDIVEYPLDGSIYILISQFASGSWKVSVIHETHIDADTGKLSTWGEGLFNNVVNDCKKIGHVDPKTLE